MREHLKIGALLQESDGVLVRDLNRNTSYDLAGSYGFNVFGYDFFKECIDRGVDRVRALGPLLGAYHSVTEDNVRRLRAVSGLDEGSFHMSGTEAVMQAVRLARYHTGRTHLVQFCGAYQGGGTAYSQGSAIRVRSATVDLPPERRDRRPSRVACRASLVRRRTRIFRARVDDRRPRRIGPDARRAGAP